MQGPSDNLERRATNAARVFKLTWGLEWLDDFLVALAAPALGTIAAIAWGATMLGSVIYVKGLSDAETSERKQMYSAK